MSLCLCLVPGPQALLKTLRWNNINIRRDSRADICDAKTSMILKNSLGALVLQVHFSLSRDTYKTTCLNVFQTKFSGFVDYGVGFLKFLI